MLKRQPGPGQGQVSPREPAQVRRSAASRPVRVQARAQVTPLGRAAQGQVQRPPVPAQARRPPMRAPALAREQPASVLGPPACRRSAGSVPRVHLHQPQAARLAGLAQAVGGRSRQGQQGQAAGPATPSRPKTPPQPKPRPVQATRPVRSSALVRPPGRVWEAGRRQQAQEWRSAQARVRARPQPSVWCATRPPRSARQPASQAFAPRPQRAPPAAGWTRRCPDHFDGRATPPSAGAIQACRNRRWPLRPCLRSWARSCCARCSKRRNPAPPGCAGARTEGLPSIGFAAWWLPLTTGSRS